MEKKTTGSFTEALLFLALVFGMTWILWVPLAALGITVGNFVGARHGSPLALIPFLLGGFVPSGVALMLTAKRQGPEGLGKLLRRVADFRIGWRWHGAAFVLVALPAACQIAILKLLGKEFDWTLFLRQLPSLIPLILIGPLSEELGWRGYLLDRLQEKFSPAVAGIAVGAAWACWHLPLYFMTGTSQHELGIPFGSFFLGVTSLSLLFTWLHNNTGGSIWTAVFFHWVFTYAAQVIATGTSRSPAYDWLEYSPYAAVALIVLLLTGLKKGRFAREPAQRD